MGVPTVVAEVRTAAALRGWQWVRLRDLVVGDPTVAVAEVRTAVVVNHLQEPVVAVEARMAAAEEVVTVTGTGDFAPKSDGPFCRGRRCFRGSLTGMSAL